MNPTPTIRKETVEDIPSIRAVVQAAFATAGEADLVDGLRRSGALPLSAVAVVGCRVVGHIGFSPVPIDGERPALARAPVAVARAVLGRGVRCALGRWSAG